MPSCSQLTEILTDYLEGRMPLDQRIAVKLHLMMCQDCTAYVQQTRLTIQALGQLPAELTPEPVRDVLLKHYRKHLGRRLMTRTKA
jgi:anti-sigma factor RsiW